MLRNFLNRLSAFCELAYRYSVLGAFYVSVSALNKQQEAGENGMKISPLNSTLHQILLSDKTKEGVMGRVALTTNKLVHFNRNYFFL